MALTNILHTLITNLSNKNNGVLGSKLFSPSVLCLQEGTSPNLDHDVDTFIYHVQ